MTWTKITDDNQPPKNKSFLGYGTHDGNSNIFPVVTPHIATVYWDPMDEAYYGTVSGWDGPFYSLTHWSELPEAPTS